MKKFFKRNKLNIGLMLLTIGLLAILTFYKFIKISEYNSFSIMSNNAIFAGFLYTGLGIMVSIIDKESIKYLDKHGYMDDYINGIKIGLFFNIFSIIGAIVLLAFEVGSYVRVIELISFETMLVGIVFFVKSILNILKLIKIVRKDNQ